MLAYNRARIDHWNKVFLNSKRRHPLARYYHRLLEDKYKFYISQALKVLELGCGDGSLLAAVGAGLPVGVDFSHKALMNAHKDHPELLLVQADAHALPFAATFDVVILSDLINDLWDAQAVFEKLTQFVHNRTRVILNWHSHLWQLPLVLAEALNFKGRTLIQNWFTLADLHTLFGLTDYNIIKHETAILAPFPLPVVSWFANRFVAKFWPFSSLAVTNFLVARPMSSKNVLRSENPSVSVVVAARNEAGNIAALLDRVPRLSEAQEIIFVEGHSRDETWNAIQEEIAKRPAENIHAIKQNGVGKADAVWEGFAASHNHLLMILDADLSVPPEDLARFYEAAAGNKGEFINGSRLVYPMENKAMQFANLIGNRLFSSLYSWLLGQPIKDTLCGTKVIWREDYLALRAQRPIRTLDPFGDFDLLLGAAKLNLKIIDLPIRYRERTYGQTNISRWRNGLQLARDHLGGSVGDQVQLKHGFKPVAASPFAKKQLGLVIYFASLLVFITMQANLIYAPIRSRSIPIEPIVSYGYTLKAEELNAGCYWRTCPALDDLRRQYQERTSDLGIELQRAIGYHRVLVLYHPLHSLMLIGLKDLGFTYAKAFDLSALIGTVFIHLGIAYWLLTLFGPGPATIAYILLAPLVFPALGLHSIGPSNYSLGFGFFLWGSILDTKRKMKWMFFPTLIGAILMHPMGKILGLIALVLYAFNCKRPWQKREIVFLAAASLLILTSLLLPSFIHSPELDANVSSWYPGSWSYAEAFINAVRSLEQFAGFFVRPIGMIGVILLLGYCGALFFRKPARQIQIVMVGMVSGLVFLSVLYLDPWYGPQLLERAWIIMGIMLTGILGFMVWLGLRTVLVLSRRVWRMARTVKLSAQLPNGLASLVALFLLLFAFSQAEDHYFEFYRHSFNATIDHQTGFMNYRLDESQPGFIPTQASAQNDQAIIYTNEALMYFYLSHGGLNYGALFAPALDDTQLQETWVQKKLSQAGYLVSENPLLALQNDPDMSIKLDDNAQLGLEPLNGQPISTLRLFLSSSARPLHLEVDWYTQDQIMKKNMAIPANTSGWVDFGLDGIQASRVTIHLIGNRSLTVESIALDESQTTHWPWAEGLKITLIPAAGDASSVEINKESLGANLPLNLEVIDDDGFSVLARVIH